MPVSEITDSVQTRVLDLINQAQDAAIDTVRTFAETVEGIVPELPALPFGRLPEPSSVVDDAFDFAAKLLDAQRRFAHELFAAAAPVTSKAVTSKAVTSNRAEKASTTPRKPVAATRKPA